MSKPEKIPIEKYDYPLPDELIAKYPLADRDKSKILVYRPGAGTGTTGPKNIPQGARVGKQEQLSHESEILNQEQLSQESMIHEHREASLDPMAQEQLSKKSDIRKKRQPSTGSVARDQKQFSQAQGLSEKRQDAGIIEQKQFFQVPELLEKSDRLYFNATRVVQARLVFRKETGARIEIFCLEPHLPADHQLAFASTQAVEFICLVGNAKKWKEGKLTKNCGADAVTAEISGRQDDKFIVRFSWNDPATSFGEILERSGSTPIPPYLNREADERDAITYQTVYAREKGSVAAPTAGLHFTEKVLGALDQKGVQRHELILHVGAGTFIPVKEKNAVHHQMHAELVTADRSLLESLLTGDRKIAVGTTTTRSLESIYWLGVKAISNAHFSFDNLFLEQWDAYELEQGDSQYQLKQSSMNEMEDGTPLEKEAAPHKLEHSLANEMDDKVPLEKAVRALLNKMNDSGIDSFSFHTRLMITPGYRFRVIGGLFTNFHQPKSTLLLLIAAVAGDDWRRIYDYALKNDFRFLSYGDSSLLFFQ
ncbi:MAG: S-adenosylmethionine:tRNA ribosyltransferase-isomerase [Bacteroidales bacterium]